MTSTIIRILIIFLGLLSTFTATEYTALAEEITPQTIPNAYRVIIRGRVLYEKSKTPVVRLPIILDEAYETDGYIHHTLKVDADGQVKSPMTETNENGRFTIVADRRFWSATGQFVIIGGLIGTTQVGLLKGQGRKTALITVKEGTKTVNLGDIVVKVE